MKIYNHNSESFELLINGYKIPESEGILYNSDWLMATISINSNNEFLNKELDFLLVEDFDRILIWLNKKDQPKRLEFVDASFSFLRFKRSNIPFLKIINQEFESDEAITWDLHLTEENINMFTNEIKILQEKFPCRCRLFHDYEQ
ncbi:WapI family immunity protein [Flavobacterium chungnamense]|uniref:DUF4265 domain-containing protein n=1 Tax=Flavobacterium chungnamense TaxID=706182 RepID=A0ABP7UUP5_9FLAO